MPHYYQTSARKENAGAHVFIAIPTYGDIKAGCVDSLNKVQHDLLANRVSLDVAILAGNCHVDDARNDLCRMFLESPATHLMFIDADLQFSPQSVRKLIEHDKDVVGGVYMMKNDETDFPVVLDRGQYQPDERGLVAVKGLPGGFMCIKRKVIEKLYKKASDKGAWPNKGNYGSLPVTEIFHRTVEKGRSRRSGDYEFCAKVLKHGFDMFMDPSLNFGHIGDKIWTGTNVGMWHLDRFGVLKQEAKRCLHNLDEDHSPEAFQKIAIAFGNQPFAVDHVLLGVLWFEMKALGKGATYLETGTGVSTAVFASAARGKSLEQSRSWRAKTEDFLEAMGFEDRIQDIVFRPVGEDGWYDWPNYETKNVKADLVFIDGPVRKVGGERAAAADHIPDIMRNATTLIVDDCDYTDGRNTLKRFEDDFGFTFEIIKGPRREFAIGRKANG